MLSPSPDLQAATWITDSDEDWTVLAGFGPGNLPGYVRVRILPDPEEPFTSEAEAPQVPGALDEHALLDVILDVLGRHTTTPDRAWFALWDGWGHTVPGFRPMMRIPHRAYFLFQGPLAAVGRWGSQERVPADDPWAGPLLPAFVWPDDRAWCLAKDVDPHWFGIGAPAAAVQELMDRPELDVVKADPGQAQPFYL